MPPRPDSKIHYVAEICLLKDSSSSTAKRSRSKQEKTLTQHLTISKIPFRFNNLSYLAPGALGKETISI
jgi:hypothetical protein